MAADDEPREDHPFVFGDPVAHFRIGVLVLLVLGGLAVRGIWQARGAQGGSPDVEVDRACLREARAREAQCIRKCRDSESVKLCFRDCADPLGGMTCLSRPAGSDGG